MYLGEKISRRLRWRLFQGLSLLHSQQSVPAALWQKAPLLWVLPSCRTLRGRSAGAAPCPALALSISSPCHVPSVFSPALRFLCLMSHLYILQVVCLAFISPISAFLEGCRGGWWRLCFRVADCLLLSGSRHQTAWPNSPWCFWHFINPLAAGGTSRASVLPGIPNSPCPGISGISFLPARASQLLHPRGESLWGRQGPHSLGHSLATAPAKTQRDGATAREGLQSASIQKGRSLNEGLRMQEKTGKTAGCIGRGKFNAQGRCYILFFKGRFFQRIFIGNFSVAIDISLRDTSSLVKTSTS